MRLVVAVLMVLSSVCVRSLAQTVAASASEWIDRPWEYRYLLSTKGRDAWLKTPARLDEFRATDSKYGKNFGKYGESVPYYFDLGFVLDGMEPGRPGDDLAVLRLDIAPDRSVAQRSRAGDLMYARLNRLGYIVLTPSQTNPAYLVDFGKLFMGAYGASDERYSPSICSYVHGDGSDGRYERKFTTDTSTRGYFGCREWAAQLYDKDRPYIDVTSYEMVVDPDAKPVKGKQPRVPATFIRPFVGFSRFSDPPKPVIGKHLQQWFCITDCPHGDAPGPIADIKAWAQRSGWPEPRRPKNVREFMDRSPSSDTHPLE